jgi:hypothetical protein
MQARAYEIAARWLPKIAYELLFYEFICIY